MGEADSAEIRACDFGVVQHWASQAARERTNLKDSRNTQWFALYLRGDATPVGCAALYQVKIGCHRVKGVFIDPVWRGEGLGTKITEHVIRLCEGVVEAYALNPPWYLARGFLAVGRNAHGVVKVRRPSKTGRT